MPEVKRIIVDTNLWISFFLSRHHRYIFELLTEEKHNILFSSELFEELRTVISREKFSKVFDKKMGSLFLREVLSRSEWVQVSSEVSACRDPNDNFLLALAKDGKADYILTGDKDLLTLGAFEKTSIITISEYLKGPK